jgi:neutral ceramidase
VPSVDLTFRQPAPRRRPAVEGLLAGAAEVDITPPPGMPKAGHSRKAHDGAGFRTRLRARVVHLRAGTSSLALVACDLHSGSALLHRMVGEAVAARTDVDLPGLFLGATHTHAGPGQFYGNDFYNRFASNRAGLDVDWTTWLAERIAGAVADAVEERRPARLAVGATEVWGFTRNRSLDAHVRNQGAGGPMTADRKYAAVNPWLHLIRVDGAAPDGGWAPLAALAVFSIHGTGVSPRDRCYNADVWAYLCGELARRVEASTGSRPVVGAVEGTHGDMTPAVRRGMLVYHEAERVGTGIGEAAAALFDNLEGHLSSRVELAAGFAEVDLDADPVVGGVRLPPPAVGCATLAGARENTTPVLDVIPPFRPAWPRRSPAGPHGPKRIFGGARGQRLVLGPSSFPRVLPFQVLAVGDVVLAGVPFEVTVAAGRRLAAAAAEGWGRSAGDEGSGSGGASAVPRVVVSSVANDYCGYLTTAEEYGLQCYEGASTLYGPRSLDFAAGCLHRLARQVAGRPSHEGDAGDYLAARRFVLAARRYLALPGPPPAADPRHLQGVHRHRGRLLGGAVGRRRSR